jgi:altered-inheritance-of-mitochondria protein 13
LNSTEISGEANLELLRKLFEVSTDHPSASRQAVIDSSIQQKLKADRERLKKLGSEVDSQVREAFRSQSSSPQSKNDDKVNSSAQLMQEISSIKEKVQHRRNENTSELMPEITQARSAIVACLKCVLNSHFIFAKNLTI